MAMIPAFPSFKPLAIEDKAAFERITHAFLPYSDFNFVSAFVWNTNQTHQICELNGNLVLILADYASHTPVLSFLGTNDVEKTAETLLHFAEDQLGVSSLTLVPREVVVCMPQTKLCIREDRDDHDYIFTIEDLIELQGGRFKSKRKAISRFLKRYGQSTIHTEILSPSVSNDIQTVLTQWNESKNNRADDDHSNEAIAIAKAIEYGEACRLLYTSVSIDDAIAGFSVDEVLPGGYAMSHFIKTDMRYVGITEYLNMCVAQQLHANGVRYWNWEQDLGIPNLRQSKMLYAPSSFLRKYIITRS